MLHAAAAWDVCVPHQNCWLHCTVADSLFGHQTSGCAALRLCYLVPGWPDAVTACCSCFVLGILLRWLLLRRTWGEGHRKARAPRQGRLRVLCLLQCITWKLVSLEAAPHPMQPAQACLSNSFAAQSSGPPSGQGWTCSTAEQPPEAKPRNYKNLVPGSSIAGRVHLTQEGGKLGLGGSI